MRPSSRIAATLSLALAIPLANPHAQVTPRDSQATAVLQRLFVAMKASDTAVTRAVFAASARVISIQPNAPAANAGQALSVDQFVGFVARNPSGIWIERIWNPNVRLSDALADVWFEYDVYRGSTFDHCGVNAVQLQETAGGWKILTMAFTSATQGCPQHPAPS